MDTKIAMIFLLIGAIIALSNLDDAALNRLRDHLARRHWRDFVPGRRKS